MIAIDNGRGKSIEFEVSLKNSNSIASGRHTVEIPVQIQIGFSDISYCKYLFINELIF